MASIVSSVYFLGRICCLYGVFDAEVWEGFDATGFQAGEGGFEMPNSTRSAEFPDADRIVARPPHVGQRLRTCPWTACRCL